MEVILQKSQIKIKEINNSQKNIRFKGELRSQIYPIFYWLERFSAVIRSEQKKPHQKILIFGWVLAPQSCPFEHGSKNANLGEEENLAPDDVIWGKMLIFSAISYI